MGIGNSGGPLGNRSGTPGGTSIAVLFHKPLPAMKASEFKKMLAPVLDFEKRSSTEQYVENLPAPVQNTTMTVGGVPVGNITFVGIPWGLVGAVQVNYQVPSGVGLGPQPVVVSVGGVPSAAATLNITG